MQPESSHHTILQSTAPLASKYLASLVMLANHYSQFGWVAQLPLEMNKEFLKNGNQGNIQITWYGSTASQVKGTVIICHPNRKDGMSMFLKEGFHFEFAKNGYNTVFLNFRGFGRSRNLTLIYIYLVCLLVDFGPAILRQNSQTYLLLSSSMARLFNLVILYNQ